MYWPCGTPQVYTLSGSINVNSEQGGRGSGGKETARGQRAHIADANGEELDAQASSSEDCSQELIGFCVATSDSFFAVITESTLTIWNNRPPVVLASTTRSHSSLSKYGTNQAVLLSHDNTTAAVQTTHGFLLIYSVEFDPDSRVYRHELDKGPPARRQSLGTSGHGTDKKEGLRELLVHLKRAIRVDAGISVALPLSNEIVVATTKPPAVQCLQWNSDDSLYTSAQLMSKMEWMHQKSSVATMIYNRAMHLCIWITSDGHAYAVQRHNKFESMKASPNAQDGDFDSVSPRDDILFSGHCFHVPQHGADFAIAGAINARFSLLAIACQNGEISIYAVKDYLGNIYSSYQISAIASISTTGPLTCLNYSPDGYCLFVGYKRGWATWSVFGKSGFSNFTSDNAQTDDPRESSLFAVNAASWTSAGAEILLISTNSRIWRLAFARSAACGYLSSANLATASLQKTSELLIYRGHDMPDLSSVSAEGSLWHHAQYPATYLYRQQPIKSSIISADRRYAAIAGQRGLAHYSIQSGRWKTFADPIEESLFFIRGGMCWFHHVLVAATESSGIFALQAYSRDAVLAKHNILFMETLSAPAVFIGTSAQDSLLVYTSDNILHHFIVSVTSHSASLLQVGQIAFHGIVRAPTRVRSVSWILPEAQLRSGDPAQDVTVASILFLVDDKLVLLQPSHGENNDLRYDMRILARQVEFYVLMRDQIQLDAPEATEEATSVISNDGNTPDNAVSAQPLQDSLWIFNGKDLQAWSSIDNILRSALKEPIQIKDRLITIPVDCYPLSILLAQGIVLCIESELTQRRDLPFSQFRAPARSHLFIPDLLQYYLTEQPDSSITRMLSRQFRHLSYFPHALEVLLHNIWDLEAEQKQNQIICTKSLLPAVLSLLYDSLSESSYLSVVTQCIRKTEITNWPFLIAHLPPPTTLFEQAIELNDLKTATGCLIVLQGFREDLGHEGGSEDEAEGYVTRLLTLAREEGDWELCAELAQFLLALDSTGNVLRRVIKAVDFSDITSPGSGSTTAIAGLGLEMIRQEEIDNQDGSVGGSET